MEDWLIELGEWIAENTWENGLDVNVDLVMALVAMHAKCVEVGEARRLFDKESVVWSATVPCYSQARRRLIFLMKCRQMKTRDPN